ncbi:MAG: hypothetical protein ACRDR6_29640 [Pseudonocardiaceae bacterium]
MSDGRTDLPAMPGMDAALHLSARTLAWLAANPHARRFAHLVWDEITEMERAGHRPATITRWRQVLAEHRPTSAGRCRACPGRRWRRPRFPCIAWHEIRSELPSFPRVPPRLGLPQRYR